MSIQIYLKINTNGDITQRQQQLDAVLHDTSAIEDRVNVLCHQLVEMQSALWRLPTEVIHIFTHCLPEVHVIPSYKQALILLTRICRYGERFLCALRERTQEETSLLL